MPVPRTPKSKLPRLVLGLRVTLTGVEPPIWRRIKIDSGATFWDLHVAIQDAMGWKDCHLHVFRVPRPGGHGVDEIGLPQEDFSDRARPVAPGWDVPMLVYLSREGDVAQYLYDFGDDWLHDVVVESRGVPEPGASNPRCTAGARACPPEDGGGADGYLRLLEILADPGHEQHAEMKDWVAEVHGPLDPEAFSPAAVKFTGAKRRLQNLRAGR